MKKLSVFLAVCLLAGTAFALQQNEWNSTHELIQGVNAGSSGELLIGNSGADPGWQAMSGDGTIDSNGVFAIAGGVLVNADVASGAAIARSKLAEDALQVYGIPLYTVRAADLAGLALTETAGDHFLSFSANVILIKGEVSSNETETSVSYFEFILPPEYVDAGDVHVRLNAQYSGDGTNNVSTIDVSAYEQTDGAVGGDLCATAAINLTNSFANCDFTITATGLVAGDVLNVKVTTAIIEASDGPAAMEAQIDKVAVLTDIKG